MRVLSIPASGTIDLISKHLIHAFPHPRSYDFSSLITFRKKGGSMDCLYIVREIFIIDFNEVNWKSELSLFNKNDKNRIVNYINGRNLKFGFENQKYMFWILEKEKELPHEPSPLQNYNNHVYFQYDELCKGEKIVKIDSKTQHKEDDICLKELKKEFNDLMLEEYKSTEKEQIVKGRIGQSLFKKLLKRNGVKCAICPIDVEAFLIASHVKPWKDCSTRERLDINNGLLLCPNHDWLFDKGFISFDNKGDIIINFENNLTITSNMDVNERIKINLNSQQKEYMQWHQEKCFIK